MFLVGYERDKRYRYSLPVDSVDLLVGIYDVISANTAIDEGYGCRICFDRLLG